MMKPDDFLPTLKDLPIKEVLEYLSAKKILDLGQRGYEKIRKLVQEKSAEKKYGFVPNKDENNFLLRVAEREYFREFGRILPKHRYSDLIRVGYLISHLNKIGGVPNRNRVEEIRESVRQRPNGLVLIKIVNLVTTGAIVSVVDYLSELKKKNYDNLYIIGVFEEIINEWKRYTYFVNAETPIEEIIKEIRYRMQNKQRLIMIFAYGSAKENTTKAIAELYKDRGDYFYESKNNMEGEKEVHASTFSLIDY